MNYEEFNRIWEEMREKAMKKANPDEFLDTVTEITTSKEVLAFLKEFSSLSPKKQQELIQFRISEEDIKFMMNQNSIDTTPETS